MVDKLQTILGQPVLVDYKPGAGGSVGAESVAKSPADGYTLMFANRASALSTVRCTANYLTTH